MKNPLLSKEQEQDFNGKIPRQLFKTWFEDGHIEATMTFTDGTYYCYPIENLNSLPQSGNPQHYEWFWRNSKWNQTFGIDY